VADVTSSPQDPFAILGLSPTASREEVYAARRLLAQRWHPDRGGDVQQMAVINDAVRRCVKLLEVASHRPPPAFVSPGRSGSDGPTSHHQSQPDSGSGARPEDFGDSVVDHPSFRVEALPVEAHEALKIVSSWLGEVVIDEPPYLLECLLNDPVRCWCQFHLLPEAGSSMVGLRVAAVDDDPVPSVRRVRDVVIAALNELDWADLDAAWR
jgi:hypothetical protein